MPTPDRKLRRRPLGDDAWVALGTIVMGAIVVYLWRPAARLDFYFDEMWRVEQVRSPDPVGAYLDGPAPIPPGWVTSLSALFDVLPARRPSLRLAAVSVGITAGVVFIVTLRRRGGPCSSSRRWHPGSPWAPSSSCQALRSSCSCTAGPTRNSLQRLRCRHWSRPQSSGGSSSDRSPTAPPSPASGNPRHRRSVSGISCIATSTR